MTVCTGHNFYTGALTSTREPSGTTGAGLPRRTTEITWSVSGRLKVCHFTIISILIIKVFIKCKILSVETILRAHTHTHTQTVTGLSTKLVWLWFWGLHHVDCSTASLFYMFGLHLTDCNSFQSTWPESCQLCHVDCSTAGLFYMFGLQLIDCNSRVYLTCVLSTVAQLQSQSTGSGYAFGLCHTDCNCLINCNTTDNVGSTSYWRHQSPLSYQL